MNIKKLDKIIVEYKNGKVELFDQIYYETEKCVFLSIYAIFKDKDLISDLMQDTYMKVISNIELYEVGTNFKAWISKVARNIAINEFNKRKRVDLYADLRSDIFEKESNMDKQLSLKNMIDFLDGEEREIIIYYYLNNMKFKEISYILDKPISTVYVSYKKALLKIKERRSFYED